MAKSKKNSQVQKNDKDSADIKAQPAESESAQTAADIIPEEAAIDDKLDGGSVLEGLQKQCDEYKDNYFRAVAELENIRRRAEKQIADAHRFALTRFAVAVSDVRDCLESALDNVGDGEKMAEGVDLTLRKLVAAMDDHHILPIRPDIGVTFDPQMHMAIGMCPPSAESPNGTVAVVVQAGYMLNGRVLRAANVMVSREADAPAADKSGDDDGKNDKADGEDTAKDT